MSDLKDFQNRFNTHVIDLQNLITEKMRSYDSNLSLNEDNWSRLDFNKNDGGGGITRAFEGSVFENAGVNTSNIFGEVNPEFAKQLNGSSNEVWASGISLIIHPHNPKIPTVHMNFRMIVQGEKFWFGGGADLTPYYPYQDDFTHFHQTWEKACKPYGVYNDYKKRCDQYFVNKHRNMEMRGVSGIFFDHVNSGNLESDFNMVVDLSNQFIKSYFPIVEKRIDEKFDQEDVDFQLHRRGRYVEFNLLHDRGTHFGLKTNGRTDSILISLPKRCKFSYCYQPSKKEHVEMLDFYKSSNT